MAETSQCTRGD
jgi:magnesium chelatase subunit D